MKRNYIWSLSMFLFLFMVGCKKEEAENNSNSSSNNTNQTPASNIDEAKILQLVNALRQTGCLCGTNQMPPVAPVVWNNLLENASRVHSQEMSDSSYFSHYSLDGRAPWDRASEAGYSWTTIGENIALGQPTEEAVIQAWKNSPGHCSNMMNGAFQDMAVAKVGSYWTQLFGKQP